MQIIEPYLHEEGDIVTGDELGLSSRSYFMYHACIKCGYTRWVKHSVSKNKVKNEVCRKYCGSIQEGRIHSSGYIIIHPNPNDVTYSKLGKHGYIAEHRYIMSEYLRRELKRNEVVHHIDGVKHNNNINNLLLMDRDAHSAITVMETSIRRCNPNMKKVLTNAVNNAVKAVMESERIVKLNTPVGYHKISLEKKFESLRNV